MSNIIMVNDGQYTWGADRAELEAAMQALGWANEGRTWTEPARGDDDDGASAYTELCQRVQPVSGYGVDDEKAGADDLPEICWAPDRQCWMVYA